jgi:hypothetical protein
VKSLLIDGVVPASFDEGLSEIIKWNSSEGDGVWLSNVLIGIRNEQNEIYRIVGFNGMTDCIEGLRVLRGVGYRVTGLTDSETAQGFETSVSK